MSNASSQYGPHIIIAKNIIHVSSHMNALQALSLNMPVQDLNFHHLMSATLAPQTQRELEPNNASRTDTQTNAKIITFLESRCRILELLQTTHSLEVVPTISRSSQSTGKMSVNLIPTQQHSYNALCVTDHLECSNVTNFSK